MKSKVEKLNELINIKEDLTDKRVTEVKVAYSSFIEALDNLLIISTGGLDIKDKDKVISFYDKLRAEFKKIEKLKSLKR